MSQQFVSLGSTPNKGDGDPLRVAFRKINENFTEMYADNVRLVNIDDSTVITSSSDGIKGQIAVYEGYLYICIDTNTWVRSPIEESW